MNERSGVNNGRWAVQQFRTLKFVLLAITVLLILFYGLNTFHHSPTEWPSASSDTSTDVSDTSYDPHHQILSNVSSDFKRTDVEKRFLSWMSLEHGWPREDLEQLLMPHPFSPNNLSATTKFDANSILKDIFNDVKTVDIRMGFEEPKVSSKIMQVSVPGCGCLRTMNITVADKPIGTGSTCNEISTLRGPKQKVVSYSLFGNKLGKYSKYFGGIERNAARIQQVLPSWIMRVYTNLDVTNGSELCRLLCKYNHLDVCDIKSLPGLGDYSTVVGTLWRFLALGEPLVDIVLLRDLDSLIGLRELAALQEWFDMMGTTSETVFHLMRDHPHQRDIMMAGMWAANNSEKYKLLLLLLRMRIIKVALKEGPRDRFYDQQLLTRFVWPIAQRTVLAHDSYLCRNYPGTVRPFPTQRENGSFVGAPLNQTSDHVCPVECRPKEHQDWLYC